jgi:hypothetical protein
MVIINLNYDAVISTFIVDIIEGAIGEPRL